MIGRTTRKPRFLVAMAFLGAVLASACGPTATPAVPPPLRVPGAEPSAGPTVPGPATTVPEAVPTETKAVVTEQYATDPSTVHLAAGRPTIVKFFAFW